MKPTKYQYADCNFHLVDFVQEGDGIAALGAAMERTGVDHAMVCGMPVVKTWSKDETVRPRYYLDDESAVYWYSLTDVVVARAVLSLPPAQRGRFHPFLCGFNPSDRNAIDHVRRMVEWFPDVWEGIGEVITHKSDLAAMTPGDVARPDSIALDPVFEFAAQYDLPVSLHCDVSSPGRREPIYLREIEWMLTKHPHTRFIWCHAGLGRRLDVPSLVDDLRGVLSMHVNLWLDLSWVIYDEMVREGRPDRRWLRLIESFPERFMVGSDLIGRIADYDATIRRYDILLDALPPPIARRVARENFLSVLPARVRAAWEERKPQERRAFVAPFATAV